MQLRNYRALFAPSLIAESSTAFSQGQVTGSAFNPAISVILDGHISSYSLDPEDYELPEFLLGEEASLPGEGSY
jgi:hypothetical protein